MAIGSHKSTARFWVSYGSGLVRIKLRAGQTLSCVEGGLTDEGYSYTGHTYSFDGEIVRATWAMNARDCDGRISRDGCSTCRVSRLKDGHVDEFVGDDMFPVIRFPAWVEGFSSQRDHAAEAAGY